MRLAVLVDVVGVATLAGDEALVLLADRAGTDTVLTHGLGPPYSAADFIVWLAAMIDLTMLW